MKKIIDCNIYIIKARKNSFDSWMNLLYNNDAAENGSAKRYRICGIDEM